MQNQWQRSQERVAPADPWKHIHSLVGPEMPVVVVVDAAVVRPVPSVGMVKSCLCPSREIL